MNDSNDNWGREPAEIADAVAAAPKRLVRRVAGSQKAKITGALIVGGVAGAAILGPISTIAASPTPAASSAPTSGNTGIGGTSGSGSAGTATPGASDQDQDGHGPGGGHSEATSDTSVVAKAIGISEADLQTALQGGQTVAAIAKAHNVNLQVVIDALLADGQAELDAAVKAGTLTQAQADAEKAEITQRATDQANGNFQGGGHH